jgi:hypothetical protein
MLQDLVDRCRNLPHPLLRAQRPASGVPHSSLRAHDPVETGLARTAKGQNVAAAHRVPSPHAVMPVP